MSSKFIGVMILLTFLLLSAAAVFQYFEMRDYQLIDALKERFFPGQTVEVVETEEDAAADGEAEPAE